MLRPLFFEDLKALPVTDLAESKSHLYLLVPNALIEACSPGPYLELFARGERPGWAMWGNQASADYEPTWATYANHTRATPTLPDSSIPNQMLLAMEPQATYRAKVGKRRS